jgi:hypothetical protein
LLRMYLLKMATAIPAPMGSKKDGIMYTTV